MINLETLFKNHFNTTKISDDKMQKFADIHLQRLAANNGGGEFTTLITDTTTAYTGYYGTITDEDTKFAVQQGLTITMNNAVEAFKKAVSQKEGIVKGNFGKDSAEYQEFFPNGASEYSQAILANIEMLMDRFIHAANDHVGVLGIPFLTEFQNYKTDYTAARDAQLQKIAEVADSKTESHQNRDVLELQLHTNLHTIAAMFPGDVDRCMDFFDQSFIRDSNNGDDEEPTPPTP
jgi:hypothetical protein